MSNLSADFNLLFPLHIRCVLCSFLPSLIGSLNYSLPESSQIPSLEFWHLWHCCFWPHTALLLFRHKNIRPSGWTFLLNRKQKGKCLGMRYLHLFAGDNWDSCTLYALAPAHIPWKSYKILCLNFLETCSNTTHGSMGIKFIIWMTSSCNVSNRFYVSLDWFKGKSTGNHGFYHQI